MKNQLFASLAAFALAFAAPVMAQKSAGERVDDGTIATSVKGSLLAEKGVPSSDVNVEVYRGVVLLSGFVKTQAEKDAAGKVAKSVKDVESVRNQLVVHPSTSMGTKLDDTVLVSKVKAALVDASDVKSGQINVEARGGIVQLGGFVTSEKMKARALAVAKGVSGVQQATRKPCVERPRSTGPLCVWGRGIAARSDQVDPRTREVGSAAGFRYHSRLQFHS
jgi:osmotically-inducible protein OsmY